MAKLVNEGDDFNGKTIRLGADIRLNDTEGWEEWGENSTGLNTWTPIGSWQSSTDNKPFSGTFDGQGHTIRGVYINNIDQYCQGLFGYIGSGGKVQNLTIAESSIKSDNYVGGIAGYNEGTIANCANSGEVAQITTNGAKIGGIAGQNNGTITDCANNGTISCKDDAHAGGVVGINKGKIVNCSSIGAVSGGFKAYAGSVAGDNYDASISNCYYLEQDGLAGIGDNSSGEAIVKTAEEYQCGAVLLLLDPDGDTWGQEIGTTILVPLGCLSEAEKEAYRVYAVALSWEGGSETLYGNKGDVIAAPEEAVAPEGYVYEWTPALPYTIQGTEGSGITITGTLTEKPEEPENRTFPKSPTTTCASYSRTTA